SHYPFWQGNATTDLAGKLQSFKSAGYKVMVVETAGYYRTASGQSTNWPYPATQAGQLQFMKDFKTTATANSACIGITYWGACWTQASLWSPDVATAWDETASRALFDNNARATSGLTGWQ